LIFAASLLCGCAPKREVVTEYRFLDSNCTPPQAQTPVKRLPMRWIALEMNGTILYATPDGASLLLNLER
jgi:hypothetical protein